MKKMKLPNGAYVYNRTNTITVRRTDFFHDIYMSRDRNNIALGKNDYYIIDVYLNNNKWYST